MQLRSLLVSLLCVSLGVSAASPALAAPEFVNGLALPGDLLDQSGGLDANTGRVGFFSDIYFDVKRKHWWGLSDRGPGGGTRSGKVWPSGRSSPMAAISCWPAPTTTTA